MISAPNIYDSEYYYTTMSNTTGGYILSSDFDAQRALDAKAMDRIRRHHMDGAQIRYVLRGHDESNTTRNLPKNTCTAIIFHMRKDVNNLTLLEREIIPRNLSWLCGKNGIRTIIQTDAHYYEHLISSNASLRETLILDDNRRLGKSEGLMYDRVVSRLRLFEEGGLTDLAEDRQPSVASSLLFIDSDLFLNIDRTLDAMGLFAKEPSSYLFYTSTNWQWGINEGLIALSAPDISSLLITGHQLFSFICEVYKSAAEDPRIRRAWPNPYEWRCGQAILNSLLPNMSVPHFGDKIITKAFKVRLLPGHLYNHIYNPLYDSLYSASGAYLASMHLTGKDKLSNLPLAQSLISLWEKT